MWYYLNKTTGIELTLDMINVMVRYIRFSDKSGTIVLNTHDLPHVNNTLRQRKAPTVKWR